MKEIKLRPCPFCGAYKVKIRVLNPDNNYYVLCQECDTKSGAYDTRLFAAKVWNTRAGDKEPYQTKKSKNPRFR